MQNYGKIKLWTFAYILVALMSSCATQSNNNNRSENNIIKVLNRVSCEVEGPCNFNIVWNKCIESGYTTQMPASRVINSRDIRELVETSITQTASKTTKKSTTDENGIVIITDSEPEQISIETKFSGYCLGTEYILQ
jgi:hypothetical protein